MQTTDGGRIGFRYDGHALFGFFDGHVAQLAPREVFDRNISPLYQ